MKHICINCQGRPTDRRVPGICPYCVGEPEFNVPKNVADYLETLEARDSALQALADQAIELLLLRTAIVMGLAKESSTPVTEEHLQLTLDSLANHPLLVDTILAWRIQCYIDGAKNEG